MRQCIYRKTSTISRTSVGNNIVDHLDIFWASPVDAAQTTSRFLTQHLASMDWANQLQDQTTKNQMLGFCASFIAGLTIYWMTAWAMRSDATNNKWLTPYIDLPDSHNTLDWSICEQLLRVYCIWSCKDATSSISIWIQPHINTLWNSKDCHHMYYYALIIWWDYFATAMYWCVCSKK